MSNRFDEQLRDAARYLRENEALRQAVGAERNALLEPHYLGVGEHNLNFRFREPASGVDYVLRVNLAKQPFHDNQVAYEYGALRALEPTGRAPRPIYLDDSPSAPEEGALVIGFCEGAELDFDELRPGDLRCAAQLMADVHAAPVGPDCTVYRPHDPLRSLFDECVQRFEAYRSSAFEEPRLTKRVESFIASAEPLTHTPCLPTDCTHIVNTEPLPSHFLIPDASAAAADAAPADGGGCFCDDPGSFIDWERPIVGEVAQDVAYFTSPTTTFWDSAFLFPSSEVQRFVEDYWRAVDGRFDRGNFDVRFRAFRAMTALRASTWCCKALLVYGRDGKGAGLRDSGHTTTKTAEKLPAYLSDDFLQLLADECF